MNLETARIASNIRNIIDKNGLKQKFVAEKAGFTESDFSRMLTGNKIIRAEYIPALARALGVTPNDLFGNGMN